MAKDNLITVQEGWERLHSLVITDDPGGLGVTTRNFANRNTGGTTTAFVVPKGWNTVQIAFMGKPADQSSAFSWKLYGYRNGNGPAQNIANGTGNLGDVALTVHPITGAAATASFYADFLTITAQVWSKTVAIFDVGASSGEIAVIQFDAAGIKHLRLELTNCDAGTADETDELEAIFVGF